MKADLWPSSNERWWEAVFTERMESAVAMKEWAAGLRAQGIDAKYCPPSLEGRRGGARELAVLHVPDDVAIDRQHEWVAANRPPASWNGTLITVVRE